MAKKPTTPDPAPDAGAGDDATPLEALSFPDMGDDTPVDPPSPADERLDKVTEQITALQTLVEDGKQREDRMLDALEKMTFRQRPDVAPAAPVAPAPAPEPVALPDPVSDPTGFSTAVGQRIETAIAKLAEAATPQAAPTSSTSDITEMLLAKFRERHPDLNEDHDLVLTAGQTRAQELIAMGLDAEAYLRAQPDKFVDEVAATVKTRIARYKGGTVGDTTSVPPQTSNPDPATRTGGIMGGNPPASSNPAGGKGEKPESMTSQIILDQDRTEFF